jgi:hypothetical protein
MDDLGRIQNRIEQLRAELRELDIAAKVLHGLRAGSNGTTRTKLRVERKAKSKGKIIDFAQDVLRGAGEQGMHFREVADAAVKLGFKGRKGSQLKTIQQSFWATMKRSPDVFDAIGSGKFKLK